MSMHEYTSESLENWTIAVENTEERHQIIILSTIAERARQLFEQRGDKDGSELDDWLAAEQELRCGEFDGNASLFCFVVDRPRDPEVTVILSLTARSLVVFHRCTKHAGDEDCGPKAHSFYLFPGEIDPAQTDVKAADGVLHVRVSKKNHPTPS
jgi:hypothetical protein